MSTNLFQKQTKEKTSIYLSQQLKEAINPYMEFNEFNLTQCIHQALTNWLLEQKTKYDCLKED